MSRFGFLIDENVSRDVSRALLRLGADVVRVGRDPGPPVGTSDPDLLRFAEVAGLAIITHDVATFPAHVARFMAQGGKTNGVFIVRPNVSDSEVISELRTLLGASSPVEWADVLTYVPFRAA